MSQIGFCMLCIYFYFHYNAFLKHFHVIRLFVLRILLYYSEIQGLQRLFTFTLVLILVEKIVERSTKYFIIVIISFKIVSKWFHPFEECFLTLGLTWSIVDTSKRLTRFFLISNAYFQLGLSVASLFHELSFKWVYVLLNT